MESKIQSLQNQIDSLQESILKLEDKGKTSKTLGEDKKSSGGHSKYSTIDLLLSNQRKEQNGDHFITLREISEKAQIEIIQLGFQRNQKGIL